MVLLKVLLILRNGKTILRLNFKTTLQERKTGEIYTYVGIIARQCGSCNDLYHHILDLQLHTSIDLTRWTNSKIFRYMTPMLEKV